MVGFNMYLKGQGRRAGPETGQKVADEHRSATKYMCQGCLKPLHWHKSTAIIHRLKVKGEDDKLTLEAEYHDLPPHANNFTDAEILACAAHRIRAHHGAEPPDINIYHAPRAIYEKKSEGFLEYDG